jgi:hypothetical protein
MLLVQVSPAGQACPHPPQLLLSLLGSTHDPLHASCAGGQEDTHAYVPPDAAHRAPAPAHDMVQLPQWALVVTSVSQPSSGLPLQSAVPGLHEVGENEHAPFAVSHATAPTTFGRFVQS